MIEPAVPRAPRLGPAQRLGERQRARARGPTSVGGVNVNVLAWLSLLPRHPSVAALACSLVSLVSTEGSVNDLASTRSTGTPEEFGLEDVLAVEIDLRKVPHR